MLLADPARQKAWADEKPLRAVLSAAAAAEILACHPATRDTPDDGGPRRMVLHVRGGGMDTWFDLPPDLDVTGLALRDGPLTGPRYVIEIETATAVIRTNIQELLKVMGSGDRADKTDADRRAAWMTLAGGFAPPRPSKPMPYFHLRRFGDVQPDARGHATLDAIPVPAFSAHPLTVEIQGAQPGSAAAFDAALDAFLSAAPRLRAEAAGRVHDSMLGHMAAVYRDPGAPVSPGLPLNPVFERLIALSPPDGIWAHVRPQGLRLVLSRKTERVHVVLSCTCTGEEEHGLALVWRDGTTLSFVGGDTGLLEQP